MLTTTDPYLGIVCPMANEGADAVRFTHAVLAQCSKLKHVTFFAVLDRATKDNSLELLRDYEKSQPRLRVVWAPENQGVVDAYVRGYREALAAGCHWILEIDAGFSHSPEDIPKFLEMIDTGYDCVFGSRFMKGGVMVDNSIKRYVISRGGTILANLMLGTRQTDMTSGFELFSRGTMEMVLARGIQSRAHFFQTEIRFYCRNLNFIEVPIYYQSPSSRLGSSALKDAFRQLWRLAKERQADHDRTPAPNELPSSSDRDLHFTAKPNSK
jgi:dolichol-phosphate mannosyltransferase